MLSLLDTGAGRHCRRPLRTEHWSTEPRSQKMSSDRRRRPAQPTADRPLRLTRLEPIPNLGLLQFRQPSHQGFVAYTVHPCRPPPVTPNPDAWQSPSHGNQERVALWARHGTTPDPGGTYSHLSSGFRRALADDPACWVSLNPPLVWISLHPAHIGTYALAVVRAPTAIAKGGSR